MFKHQKGISTLVIVIIIAVATLVIIGLLVGGYMTWRYFEEKEQKEERKERREEEEEEQEEIQDSSSRQEAKDNHIMSDMSMLRVIAEMISIDEGDSYASFSCQHQDVKDMCDSIKDYAGTWPNIHSSANEHCAYVKLLTKEDGRTKYCCANNLGDFVITTTNPGQRGYCDGTSFVCPGDELLLLK